MNKAIDIAIGSELFIVQIGVIRLARVTAHGLKRVKIAFATNDGRERSRMVLPTASVREWFRDNRFGLLRGSLSPEQDRALLDAIGRKADQSALGRALGLREEEADLFIKVLSTNIPPQPGFHWTEIDGDLVQVPNDEAAP